MSNFLISNLFNKTREVKALWLSLIANIIFLIIFELYLKTLLLNHFRNLQDPINSLYYTNIFLYLEYPVFIILVITVLLIKFYSAIKAFFTRISINRPFLIFIVLLNIFIQLIVLLTVHTIPISDSKFYIESGHRLFLTGSYISSNGRLTSFWPVGLPAFLAFLEHLSSHYLFIAKLINIIISSSFILIIFLIFKKELPKKGLLILLIGFTLWLNNIFSVNSILTDYPFAFLLWLTILLSLAPNLTNVKIILIAFIFGLLAYLRPVGLLLPLICIGYILKKYSLKTSLKKTILLFSIFLLLLVPWIYRNYNVFHTFVPISTNGGFNFLKGNNVHAFGGANFDFFYSDSLSEVENSKNAYYEGFKDLVDNPIKSVIKLPMKIFFSYYRGDSSITWSLKQTKNKIPPILLSTIFFVTNYFFYLIIFISILCIISKKKGFISQIRVYMILIRQL